MIQNPIFFIITTVTPCKRVVETYPLFVNDLKKIRCANKFMQTVVKEALNIDNYWASVEFTPISGQIHIHKLGIARARAYLDAFCYANTMEEKTTVINGWGVYFLSE